MKSSIARLLSAGFAATAMASIMRPPQHTDDPCCFGLTSLGLSRDAQVKQTSDGQLVLGGDYSQAGFCLEPSNNTILDGQGHSCSIDHDSRHFHCHAESTNATSFGLLPGVVHGEPFLMWLPGTMQGDTLQGDNFWACPTGPLPDPYYNIYAGDKFDMESPDAGCLLMGLVLTEPTSTCEYSRNKTSNIFPRGSSKTSQASSAVSSVEASPSATCILSDSSPSVAPSAIGIWDHGVSTESHHHVDITPRNYSEFAFSLSREFVEPHQTYNQSANQSAESPDRQRTRCALEFRMPTCSQLPPGYPCYHFSGIEQEFLSNSGMNINLQLRMSFDGPDGSDWDNSTLHQVFPGDTTVIGTFDCTIAPEANDSVGYIQFEVFSVRGFSLSFEQAGSHNYNFTDGIGMWVRRCL
ncbi:hypothetical protein GGR57DRAFT_401983 [Xylariaceae sp. FL1272]|nr:hypothetical protein GGR57DRAFT_401983 [Xylariaceae sp. FL1272]